MKNVIIGAGVFGMATAIELIQEGNDVLVIDSNNCLLYTSDAADE